MKAGVLSSVFLASLDPVVARRLRPISSLEPALEKVLARAHAAWPGLSVGDTVFLRRLARGVGQSREPWVVLRTLHVEDLFFACGYEAHLPLAIAHVEAEVLPALRKVLARIDRLPEFIDDALQVLREKLLVSQQGGTPKIAEYSGHGPLLTWLRAVTTGTGLNLFRQRKRNLPLDDEPLWEEPAPDNPELDHLRAQFGKEFDDALRASVAALTPRERSVLRLHVLGRLSVVELGKFFRVHHSTASRWLSGAEEELVERTRRELSQRLRLTTSELESLLRFLRTRLTWSLGPFLVSATS